MINPVKVLEGEKRKRGERRKSTKDVCKRSKGRKGKVEEKHECKGGGGGKREEDPEEMKGKR